MTREVVEQIGGEVKTVMFRIISCTDGGYLVGGKPFRTWHQVEEYLVANKVGLVDVAAAKKKVTDRKAWTLTINVAKGGQCPNFHL